MSQFPSIYVADIGMINPVGANPIMTSASVRAGVSAIEETAILNKKLKPIKMALVPDDALPQLKPTLATSHIPTRQLRLLQLAAAALVQLQARLTTEKPIPVFLSLPENLPHLSVPVVGNFVEQLMLQSDIPLNSKDSLVAQVGRAGAFHAVDLAHKYLAESGHDYVLIGGVDTYWDNYLLAKLDAEDRLMVEGSTDGFFPGEGACFLLLASERVKDQIVAPQIRLAAPGFGSEKGHRYSDEPYRGDGLSAAITAALQYVPVAVDNIWTSMIYDGFCHKEIGVALTRNSGKISPNVRMTHPVDCFGDIGAAIGCTLIALAALSYAHTKNAQQHLLCCSSELSHRSALCLSAV